VKTHSAAPTKVSRLMGAEGELCSRSAQSICVVYKRHVARGVLEVVPERVRVGLVLFMLQEREVQNGGEGFEGECTAALVR
jgi:hypothetical protein